MRRCAPILGVTFALLACKPDPVLERVTGVRVTVETPKKDLDQYRYRIQDGAAMILSGALPDTPAPITDPSTSFVLVVDDALAGRELLLDVDAVRDAELVASGRVALTFVASTIVDVLVVLGEPAVCGDGVIQNNVEECDDGDRDNGDGCNLGCIVEPNFECRNEPSVCTSVDLECNGSCATGQRCLGGACICDAESCPTGCCAGEVCQSWDRGTCGPAGGQCSACDVLASDRCIGGQCQCGNGGPCGVGQLCSGGRCVCTVIHAPAAAVTATRVKSERSRCAASMEPRARPVVRRPRTTARVPGPVSAASNPPAAPARNVRTDSASVTPKFAKTGAA